MTHGETNSLAFTVLGDDQYDEIGWPKGLLSVSWRSFDLLQGPNASWVAEYPDLPGYCGEGTTVEQALQNLWQDLGSRPHYRVKRKRRSEAKWLLHFKSRYNATAAGAFIGFSSLSKDTISETAKAFPAKGERIQKANREFVRGFEASDGSIVAGQRKFNAKELRTLADQQIGTMMFAARNVPWRLERQEARDSFPVPNG